MPGNLDMNTLTREQLMYLVEVRGQALEFNDAADRKFLDKMGEPGFQQSDLDEYVEAKNQIAAQQMEAEELIIGGTGQTAN